MLPLDQAQKPCAEIGKIIRSKAQQNVLAAGNTIARDIRIETVEPKKVYLEIYNSLPIHVTATVASRMWMPQLAVRFSIILASVANEIYARRVKIVKVAATPASQAKVKMSRNANSIHTNMYMHVCLGVFK